MANNGTKLAISYQDKKKKEKRTLPTYTEKKEATQKANKQNNTVKQQNNVQDARTQKTTVKKTVTANNNNTTVDTKPSVNTFNKNTPNDVRTQKLGFQTKNEEKKITPKQQEITRRVDKDTVENKYDEVNKALDKELKDKENITALKRQKFEKARSKAMKEEGIDARTKFDNLQEKKIDYNTKKEDATHKLKPVDYSKVEEKTKKERSELNTALNDERYVQYVKDEVKAQTEPVTLAEKTIGVPVRATQDFLSTALSGEKYTDPNTGQQYFLPSYSDLRQQKVSQSYDTGVGKFLGDTVYNTTKIGEAALLDTITAGIGGKALYWSDMAADNYKNAINRGYSREQALANTAVSTASEFLTEKLLGGLSKTLTGGKASEVQNLIGNVVNKLIKNPKLAEVIGSMGSEGLEEFVQEYIDQWNELATLKNSKDVKDYLNVLLDPDVFMSALYSAGVGAGSGGMMTGSQIAIGMDTDGRQAERNIEKNNELKQTLEEKLNNTKDKELKQKYQDVIDAIDEYNKKPFGNDTQKINNNLNELELKQNEVNIINNMLENGNATEDEVVEMLKEYAQIKQQNPNAELVNTEEEQQRLQDQAKQVANVREQVQNKNLTPEQGKQALQEIQEGTFRQNMMYENIAQKQYDNIMKELKNGKIDEAEATRRIQALAQTLEQQKGMLEENTNGDISNSNDNIVSNTNEVREIANEKNQETTNADSSRKEIVEKAKQESQTKVIKHTQSDGTTGRAYKNHFFSDSEYSSFSDKEIKQMVDLTEKGRKGEVFTPNEQKQIDYLKNKQNNNKDVLKRKEQGLKNPELNSNISKFEDVSSGYKYVKNFDESKFDSTMVQKAEDIVSTNKQGRRTKQQWLDVAKNIGMQADNLDSKALEKLAFESWAYTKPNQREQLNRQGAKKVDFQVHEWVKAVYEGARVGEKIETSNVQDAKIEKNASNKKQDANMQKTKIIDKIVNDYIEKTRNDFKTNINIDTNLVNKEKINYSNEKQTTIYKKARDLFQKIGKKVFKNNDETIYVDNSDISESIRKTLEDINQKNQLSENIAVFSKLDKIIENAELIGEAKFDTKNRTDRFKDYKYYVSNVTIDGNPYVVQFDTRLDNKDGSDKRHFVLERVYPIQKETSATGQNISSVDQFGTDVSRENNVSQSIENVNNNQVTMKDAMEAFNRAKRFGTEVQNKAVQTFDKAMGENNPLTKQQMEKIRHDVHRNEDTVKKAKSNLDGMSFEQKYERATQKLNSNKAINEVDVAEVIDTLVETVERGTPEQVLNLLQDYSIMETEAGRVVQAASLLRKASPVGQLAMLNKIVARQQKLGNKKWADVKLNQDLVQNVLDTYENKEQTKWNQAKMEEAVDELKQDIADQLKMTVSDKLNAWRYLSMLGNPKTHIRNVAANTVMSVVKGMSDKLSGGLQDVFITKEGKYRFTGNDAVKTKTAKFASKDVKQFSNLAFEEMKPTLSGNKYDNATGIEAMRSPFNNKVLRKLDELNSGLLNIEDLKAKETNFKKSFSNYLTAQGIETVEDINNNPDIIDAAKAFALQEANIATFNQDNKLATYLNKLDNLGPVAKVLRGAIIPFTRTPLNIAKTGIEYTPVLGTLTTLSDLKKVDSSMKGAVMINGLSKQTVGAGLLVMGYMLAKNGVLTADSGDDKDDKFEKDQGAKMDFSLKLPASIVGDGASKVSLDLSWLSPSSMPLLVGAAMHEQFSKHEGINEDMIIESLAGVLDPLSEMSCISSFTDVLDSYSNSSAGKFMGIAKSTSQNYISQFIPTVSSQIAKTFDAKKRSTYADKSSSHQFTQETLRKLMYKIPGARNLLPEQTDYFGDTKKEIDNMAIRALDAFFNPANHKTDTMSKESKELIRLYNKTGNDAVLPGNPNTYINYNDKQYTMTQKEFNKYKKDFGEAAKKNVKEVMDSEEYRSASDDEKAEMIEGVMKYAKDVAKDNFLTSKGQNYVKINEDGEETHYESDNVNEITQATNYSIADYYITKTITPNLLEGNLETKKKKLGMVSEFGFDAKTYNQYLEEIGNIEADKTASGKSINGTRKRKIIAYLNSLDLTPLQRAILLKQSYKSFRSYDGQIINTIRNSNLNDEDKEIYAQWFKLK